MQVVKSGLKFGTDFVLYRRGPAHYHAEWSVMVQACGEGVPGGQWSAGGRQLSWRNLATLNRLSEQVAKVRGATARAQTQSRSSDGVARLLMARVVGSAVVQCGAQQRPHHGRV
jgi:hypothetical protein